jgi:hypothetical protein
MTGFAFVGCSTIVEIDEANRVFGVCGDFIVNLERKSLVRYLGSSPEVLIQNKYEQIDVGCFDSRSDISRLTFESGSRVSVFGVSAFAYCTKLESIHIGRTVDTICEKCFYICTGLRRVTFERGSRVSVLGVRAFSQCSSLKSICIPSSVTTIGTECFFWCDGLSVVELGSGSRVSRVGQDAFSRCSSKLHLPSRLSELLPRYSGTVIPM